jgi:hypothetical protein
MKLKYLKNKRIYLSPYNDLSIKLNEKLKLLGIEILGFVDSYKSGKDIYKKEQIVEYDYVIVSSGVHWHKISTSFDKNKTIISNQDLSLFTLYPKYMKSLKKYSNNSYDILFMPHNKAHTLDMIPIARELQVTTSYNIAFIDIKDRYDNEGAYIEILKSNIPYIPIDVVKLGFVKLKLFICMNDWEQSIAYPLVIELNKKSITTLGIVEGITDFTDVDYRRDRNAYQTVEYVLTTGRNDLKYLKDKRTSVMGIPKIRPLWNKQKKHFPKQTLIVINLSFLALSYNEYGTIWLKNVVEACKDLNLSYIISKHPNDTTDTKNFNVTNKTIYEILDEGSLLISRFSTTILESIALGKPAVYFKPQPEKTTLYDNNFEAFSIAHDKQELKEKILYELEHKDNVRERANKFLDLQCNINETEKPEILAAHFIQTIL